MIGGQIILPGRFLRAEWKHLAMINFEIDPGLLLNYRPRGTELDDWQGRTYLSIVGFLFEKTRVYGAPLPFHSNFEEINLRFYVRYRADDGWRRGVVFIKEIVPRRAIATVARLLYNENYAARRMKHRIERIGSAMTVEYGWWEFAGWNRLVLTATGAARLPAPDSEEEFITEHYWGYSAQRDGGCLEYRVEHPPWRVWRASDVQFECDIDRVYGREFMEYLQAKPRSAFLAEGSPVAVRRGVRI